MVRFLALTALAVLTLGCTGRAPTGRAPSTPPVAETPSSPRPLRIAVVDLARVTRVHPRWPEVMALDRQIGDLQARLAVAVANGPTVIRVDLPKVDLTPEMKAAIERMRPEVQHEAEAVKAAARQELNTYVAQLRAEQQKKVETKQAEAQATLTKAVDEKQQALAKDNQQFQQQTMAEYRLQLLNLKLKLEDVQQTSKGEADRLNAQIQAVTKERDDKIAAHEKANQQVLQQFQTEQVQAAMGQVKAYQDQLTKEGQQLVDERSAKATEEVRAKLEAMQAEFNQRLRRQQQSIISAARDTQSKEVEKIKTQAQKQVQSEVTQVRALQGELQAAQRARARVFAVILADLRIETVALAQEQRWDMVLTQAIAAPGTIDGTDELIARIKR
jgi:DNA repair exonuclease SbcCD ATPase subunit